MKALGGKVVEGRVDLPSDMDGVLDVVKTVLKLGGVQLIKMDLENGLTFKRVSSDSDNHPFETSRSYVDMPITDVVRQKTVEESPLNGSNTLGPEHLLRAFWCMSLKDLVVTHMIVGPGTVLWKWLGLDPMASAHLTHLMGAHLEVDKTLGKDKVLLCGARSKTATVDEIEYSMAVHMEVAE